MNRPFTSFDQFAEFLKTDIVRTVGKMELIAAIAADILYLRAHDLYGRAQSAGGPLADLSQATQDSRSRMGDGDPNRPLIIDGNLLQESLESYHDIATAAIGSDEVIHAYHEFGYTLHNSGTQVPPRPIFKLALDDSEEAIMAVIVGEVGEMLGFEKFYPNKSI